MADCILMQAGGGGLDPDELTATAGDVLKGKIAGVAGTDDPVAGTLELTGTAADSQVLSGQTYYNTDAKTKRTGTQINRGAWTGSVGMNGSVTVPAGFHNGGGAVSGPAVTQRGAWASSVGRNGRVTVPEGYHNGAGYVNGPAVTERGAWATNIGINGRTTIPEGYHNGSGYVGQSLPVQGWNYVTPGTSNQVVCSAGRWASGDQGVYGDANLVAGNIRKGKTIFGVTGMFQGYTDSPLYLYDRGTWSNLQQIEMTATGFARINYTSGQISIEGARTISSIDSFFGGRLNQQVDITAYNFINVNVIGFRAGAPIVGVSSSSTTDSKDKLTAYTRASSLGILKMDISSLSGMQFIYLGYLNSFVNQEGDVIINKIYLSTS